MAEEEVFEIDVNKLKRVISKARIDVNVIVPHKTNVLAIIKKAEEEEKIFKIRKDSVYFCCYRTDLDDEPSLLLVFMLKISSGNSRSRVSNEIVMSLIKNLEKLLINIDHIMYNAILDANSQKNIITLKIIKKIKEDDWL